MMTIKTKGFLVVLATLLLVTASPSAMAGKPTQTLNGSVCKGWGGVWTSGKNTVCYVPLTAYVYDVNSIVIKSGTTLILHKSININEVLTNEGTIQIDSDVTLSLTNSNSRFYSNTASGTIVNYGTLSVASGAVFQNSNSSYFLNRGILLNGGTFDNFGRVVNGQDGSGVPVIINSGIVNNTGTNSIDNTYGIISNCTNAQWNGANPNPLGNFNSTYGC